MDPSSGSVAGQTYSRNRFGQYIRTRAIPVNPNSPAQAAVRNSLADNSQAWQALTAPQRLAWNNYSALHPRSDSLGQSITLSGFQSFVGVNSLLSMLAIANVTAPPLEPAFTPADVNNVDSPGGLDIEIDFAAAVAAKEWLLYSSPPKSLGTAFNRDYRFLSAIGVVAAPGAESVTADFVAKWGTLAVGQRFFVRMIQQIGGVKSTPLDFIVDVAA